MRNVYLQRMAQLLTTYCLDIQAGDIFRITADIAALPLVQEVYRAAIQAGAYIVPRFYDNTLDELLLREGSIEQIQYLSPALLREAEIMDKWLHILSDTNTKQFTSIDPERRVLKRRALEPMRQVVHQRRSEGLVRSCFTLYPTEAYAQEAHMSLMEFEQFLFTACRLDAEDPGAAWEAQERAQQRVVNFLTQCRHLRIVAPGTDLEYRSDGRTWINCAGKLNLPDGEIFTSPIEDSVQGHIAFSSPSIYQNTTVEGITLTFVNGKVVEATARQGQAFLNRMLDMDAGSRYVGEVAFGMNEAIQQTTGSTLFDEKIGGTMHLALGWSIPGSGGKNQSALHWDLVCDLHEGEVYADGELCYQQGRFVA